MKIGVCDTDTTRVRLYRIYQGEVADLDGSIEPDEAEVGHGLIAHPTCLAGRVQDIKCSRILGAVD